jgi:hypothetical protein
MSDTNFIFFRTYLQLFLAGHPTAEDVNHLILTLQWAGVACISQVKTINAFVIVLK